MILEIYMLKIKIYFFKILQKNVIA